jgi:hypothetical protein
MGRRRAGGSTLIRFAAARARDLAQPVMAGANRRCARGVLGAWCSCLLGGARQQWAGPAGRGLGAHSGCCTATGRVHHAVMIYDASLAPDGTRW